MYWWETGCLALCFECNNPTLCLIALRELGHQRGHPDGGMQCAAGASRRPWLSISQTNLAQHYLPALLIGSCISWRAGLVAAADWAIPGPLHECSMGLPLELHH